MGDEHPIRSVGVDVFDRVIGEIVLERPDAGEQGENRGHHVLALGARHPRLPQRLALLVQAADGVGGGAHRERLAG